MKRLILILCIAMSGNAYGQTAQIFDENIKNTTLDLYEDLVYLNSDVLKDGVILLTSFEPEGIHLNFKAMLYRCATLSQLIIFIKASTKSPLLFLYFR